MRYLAIAAFALCVVSVMGVFTACGGGNKSSGPVAYEPDLRYPNPNPSIYYDPDYTGKGYTYSKGGSIWTYEYPYSTLTYLTPAGQHRDDLHQHGLNWLYSYPDAHIAGEPGTLAVEPQDFIFEYGAAYDPSQAWSPMYLRAIGDNQAYVIYAIKDIPDGCGITNVTVAGEWTYVDMAAYGGLRIGISNYNNKLYSFTDYLTGGDLYHPRHWMYSSKTGILPGPGGTAYIFVMVHGGLEARIDGLTVTIDYTGDYTG